MGKLKDRYQVGDEGQYADFPIPAGLLADSEGDVVRVRVPTAREALDLREAVDAGGDDDLLVLRSLFDSIHSGEEVLAASELDLDRLPGPMLTFVDRCVSAVMLHGAQQAGEALAAWRARQSTAASSTATSETS